MDIVIDHGKFFRENFGSSGVETKPEIEKTPAPQNDGTQGFSLADEQKKDELLIKIEPDLVKKAVALKREGKDYKTSAPLHFNERTKNEFFRQVETGAREQSLEDIKALGDYAKFIRNFGSAEIQEDGTYRGENVDARTAKKLGESTARLFLPMFAGGADFKEITNCDDVGELGRKAARVILFCTETDREAAARHERASDESIFEELSLMQSVIGIPEQRRVVPGSREEAARELDKIRKIKVNRFDAALQIAGSPENLKKAFALSLMDERAAERALRELAEKDVAEADRIFRAAMLMSPAEEGGVIQAGKNILWMGKNGVYHGVVDILSAIGAKKNSKSENAFYAANRWLQENKLGGVMTEETLNAMPEDKKKALFGSVRKALDTNIAGKLIPKNTPMFLQYEEWKKAHEKVIEKTYSDEKIEELVREGMKVYAGKYGETKAEELASPKLHDDQWAQDLANQATFSLAYMTPSLVAGAAAGAPGFAIAMGLQGFGESYNERYSEGDVTSSVEERAVSASLYGAFMATTNAFLYSQLANGGKWVWNKIASTQAGAKIGSMIPGSALTRFATRSITDSDELFLARYGNSVAQRTCALLGRHLVRQSSIMLEEGSTEALEEAFKRFANEAILDSKSYDGNDVDRGNLVEALWESFKVGALIAPGIHMSLSPGSIASTAKLYTQKRVELGSGEKDDAASVMKAKSERLWAFAGASESAVQSKIAIGEDKTGKSYADYVKFATAFRKFLEKGEKPDEYDSLSEEQKKFFDRAAEYWKNTDDRGKNMILSGVFFGNVSSDNERHFTSEELRSASVIMIDELMRTQIEFGIRDAEETLKALETERDRRSLAGAITGQGEEESGKNGLFWISTKQLFLEIEKTKASLEELKKEKEKAEKSILEARKNFGTFGLTEEDVEAASRTVGNKIEESAKEAVRRSIQESYDMAKAMGDERGIKSAEIYARANGIKLEERAPERQEEQGDASPEESEPEQPNTEEEQPKESPEKLAEKAADEAFANGKDEAERVRLALQSGYFVNEDAAKSALKEAEARKTEADRRKAAIDELRGKMKALEKLAGDDFEKLYGASSEQLEILSALANTAKRMGFIDSMRAAIRFMSASNWNVNPNVAKGQKGDSFMKSVAILLAGGSAKNARDFVRNLRAVESFYKKGQLRKSPDSEASVILAVNLALANDSASKETKNIVRQIAAVGEINDIFEDIGKRIADATSIENDPFGIYGEYASEAEEKYKFPSQYPSFKALLDRIAKKRGVAPEIVYDEAQDKFIKALRSGEFADRSAFSGSVVPEAAVKPNEWRARTPSAENSVVVSGEYRVVDADELTFVDVSDKAQQNEQERNREGNRTQQQTRGMLDDFVAERLLEDAHTDRGAPIYRETEDGKLRSVSGEGRSRLIKDIYESGGEPEAQYRAALEKFARERGIEIPAGIKKPVLVRVAKDTNGMSWEKLAKASNMDMKAAYTAAERSHADARELPKIIDLLNATESGDVMSAANDAFLAAFNEAVQAGTTYLQDAKEGFNEQLGARVLESLVAYVINDRETATRLMDSPISLGHIYDALYDLAPTLVRMRRNEQYDLSREIAAAIKAAIHAKTQRENGNTASAEHLIDTFFEGNTFEGIEENPRTGIDLGAAKMLAKLMVDYGNRYKLKRVLKSYIEDIKDKNGIDGRETSLFGETDWGTKADIIKSAIEKNSKESAGGSKLSVEEESWAKKPHEKFKRISRNDQQRLASLLGEWLPGIKVRVVDSIAEATGDANAKMMRERGIEEPFGAYDPKKNEVVVRKHARVDTLMHELAWHATFEFARRASEKLKDGTWNTDETLSRLGEDKVKAIADIYAKMREFAANAPESLKKSLREAYEKQIGTLDEETMLDEYGARLFTELYTGKIDEILKTKVADNWVRSLAKLVSKAWKLLCEALGGKGINLERIAKMDAQDAMNALADAFARGKRFVDEGKGNENVSIETTADDPAKEIAEMQAAFFRRLDAFARANPQMRFSKSWKENRYSLGESGYEAEQSVLARKYSIDAGTASLVGLHEISEEKLRKAIALGGLANPSLGVVDLNARAGTGFGAITLIAPRTLIDKKTGRNAGTYAGDAWTPMVPQVKLIGNEKTMKAADAYIDGRVGNPEIAQHVKTDTRAILSGRGNNQYLRYVFLKERGIPVPERVTPIRFPEGTTRKVIDILGNESFFAFESELSDAQKRALTDLYFEVSEKPDASEKMKNALKKMLTDDKGLLNYNVIREFLARARSDYREGGKLDAIGTISDAVREVSAMRLESEYEQWRDELLKSFGAREQIYAGETRTGRSRYIDATLENISKEMNKKAVKDSGDDTNFGSIKASLLKSMTSLKQIRSKKDLLNLSDADAEAAVEETKDRLVGVFNAINAKKKLVENPFMNFDYSVRRVKEALNEADPVSYLENEYGYEIEEKLAQELSAVKELMQNLPAKYFETKFRRPVELGEFRAAVVPAGTDAAVVSALKNAGVSVEEYAADDAEDRAAKVRGVAAKASDVRFSLAFDDAGFIGHKMPVSGTRRSDYRDGHNYVIYNADERVKITGRVRFSLDESEYEAESSSADYLEPSDFGEDGRVKPEILAEIEAEKAKIREDAQKNGTFGKAPNGAPSNLDAEQWVLVRTKRFKRWFGDWEAAENAKISDVAKSFNDLRAILKKLVGKEMSSKDGIKATLSGRSIDKICSGKSFEKSVSRIAHFAAAENIEHLFENSIELTSEPGNKSGVKAMHRLYAPFFFEGQTLVAKISVKEFSNSEENRIYTVEAIDVEKPAGDLAPKQSEKIGKSNPTQASLLKDIKSLMKSVNDVSKVVDENGEPLVVYHGTGEKFYEFDKAKIGSSTRNKGIFGNGFYMTDDYDYASYYNRSGGRINKDGGNVMPLFMSLKTPFEWSGSNALRAAKSAGFPKSRIKNGKLLPLTEENQILSFTENLKNSGHDGVVFDFENGVREFVAFEPEQIKSATENAGTYAPENPDIRYSLVSADHGSPHLFEKEEGAPHGRFRDDKMGTGEGAQAFGWGHYLTNRRGIARSYAEMNDVPEEEAYQIVYDNGQTVESFSTLKEAYDYLREMFENELEFMLNIESEAAQGSDEKEVYNSAKEYIEDLNGEDKLEEFRNDYLKNLFDFLNVEYSENKDGTLNYDISVKDVLKLLEEKKDSAEESWKEWVRSEGINFLEDVDGLPFIAYADADSVSIVYNGSNSGNRNIYTAEFDTGDADENLLDWKNPITTNQKTRILARARSEFGENGKETQALETVFSESKNELPNAIALHKNPLMKKAFGSPKEISKFLKRAGFIGHKFPAQSGGFGDYSLGTNYVIYSGEDLKIKKHIRYSLSENEEETEDPFAALDEDVREAARKLTNHEQLKRLWEDAFGWWSNKILDAAGIARDSEEGVKIREFYSWETAYAQILQEYRNNDAMNAARERMRRRASRKSGVNMSKRVSGVMNRYGIRAFDGRAGWARNAWAAIVETDGESEEALEILKGVIMPHYHRLSVRSLSAAKAIETEEAIDRIDDAKSAEAVLKIADKLEKTLSEASDAKSLEALREDTKKLLQRYGSGAFRRTTDLAERKLYGGAEKLLSDLYKYSKLRNKERWQELFEKRQAELVNEIENPNTSEQKRVEDVAELQALGYWWSKPINDMSAAELIALGDRIAETAAQGVTALDKAINARKASAESAWADVRKAVREGVAKRGDRSQRSHILRALATVGYSLQARLESAVRYAGEGYQKAIDAIRELDARITEANNIAAAKVDKDEHAFFSALLRYAGKADKIVPDSKSKGYGAMSRAAENVLVRLCLRAEGSEKFSKRGEKLTWLELMAQYLMMNQKEWADMFADMDPKSVPEDSREAYDRWTRNAELAEFLGEEKVKLAEETSAILQAHSAAIDAEAVKITGTALSYSRGDGYFPIVHNIDEYMANVTPSVSGGVPSVVPKMLIPRQHSRKDIDEHADLFSIFRRHVYDVALFEAQGETGIGSDLREFLGEDWKGVREDVAKIIGSGNANDIWKQIAQTLNGKSMGSYNETASGKIVAAAAKVLRFIARMLGLGFNIVSTAKQAFGSIPSYMLEYGTANTLKALLRSPLAAIDFAKELIDSDGYSQRYGNAAAERAMSVISRTRSLGINTPRAFQAIARFENLALVGTAYGDRVPMFTVGAPIYAAMVDKYLRDGNSVEEAKRLAMRDFWAMTDKTQQARQIQNQDLISSGTNEFKKMFVQFLTSPIQFASNEIHAAEMFLAHPSKENFGKLMTSVLHNHLIEPLIMTLIVYYIRGIGDDDEEDLLAKLEIKDFALGSFSAMPYFGSLTEYYLFSDYSRGYGATNAMAPAGADVTFKLIERSMRLAQSVFDEKDGSTEKAARKLAETSAAVRYAMRIYDKYEDD